MAHPRQTTELDLAILTANGLAAGWGVITLLVLAVGVPLTPTYLPWWWPAGLILLAVPPFAIVRAKRHRTLPRWVNIGLILLIGIGLVSPLQLAPVAAEWRCVDAANAAGAPQNLGPSFITLDATPEPWTSTARCRVTDYTTGAPGGEWHPPLYSLTRGTLRPKPF